MLQTTGAVRVIDRKTSHRLPQAKKLGRWERWRSPRQSPRRNGMRAKLDRQWLLSEEELMRVVRKAVRCTSSTAPSPWAEWVDLGKRRGFRGDQVRRVDVVEPPPPRPHLLPHLPCFACVVGRFLPSCACWLADQLPITNPSCETASPACRTQAIGPSLCSIPSGWNYPHPPTLSACWMWATYFLREALFLTLDTPALERQSSTCTSVHRMGTRSIERLAILR